MENNHAEVSFNIPPLSSFMVNDDIWLLLTPPPPYVSKQRDKSPAMIIQSLNIILTTRGVKSNNVPKVLSLYTE